MERVLGRAKVGRQVVGGVEGDETQELWAGPVHEGP